MAMSLKYAVVERERRYLLASMPAGTQEMRVILDRYVVGTRLRLREVRSRDGSVLRKLNHKVRLGDGPAEVASTSCYLDDDEWTLLQSLPAYELTKHRHTVRRDGLVVVDQHVDGSLIAEVDDGDGPPGVVPNWLDVVEDVSDDEAWTGAALAARLGRMSAAPG
ncbi:hypothetical protein [Nocardioides sp. J9]|uniref:hypothetical protein n=1 Tax=Nocardioides sp. J9 TaxID=935844 RepID=UPI00119F9FEB|nr:hypothetical protein [Nocardioides sp. J9]